MHLGTKPLSERSTAFNVDVERGEEYAAGDMWGSIGAWFAGRRHTEDAERYIADVKSTMAAKPWEKPNF